MYTPTSAIDGLKVNVAPVPATQTIDIQLGGLTYLSTENALVRVSDAPEQEEASANVYVAGSWSKNTYWLTNGVTNTGPEVEHPKYVAALYLKLLVYWIISAF